MDTHSEKNKNNIFIVYLNMLQNYFKYLVTGYFER